MGKKYIDEPIGYQVLVKQEELPEFTDSGIALYPTYEEYTNDQVRHTIGTVEAIGPFAFQHERFGYTGQDDWQPPFKEGDKVRFGVMAGHPFRSGRDEHNMRCGDFMILMDDVCIYSKVREEKHEWPKKEQDEPVIATPDNQIIMPA